MVSDNRFCYFLSMDSIIGLQPFTDIDIRLYCLLCMDCVLRGYGICCYKFRLSCLLCMYCVFSNKINPLSEYWFTCLLDVLGIFRSNIRMIVRYRLCSLLFLNGILDKDCIIYKELSRLPNMFCSLWLDSMNISTRFFKYNFFRFLYMFRILDVKDYPFSEGKFQNLLNMQSILGG